MKALIVGLGNILLGDDGAGVWASKRLKELVKDSAVEIIDGGTAVTSLPLHMYPAIIAIDAVKISGKSLGEIIVLTKEDLLNTPDPLPLSGHSIDFIHMLKILDFSGELPNRVWLIGICVEEISSGMELSDRVKSAVEKACKIVLEILKNEL